MEPLTTHALPIPTKKLVDVVCGTCLSANRRLISLNSNHPHLKNVCVGIELTSKDKVCWECNSILLKLWLFQQRALKSKMILTQLLLNDKILCSDEGLSLSTLGLSEIYSIDNRQEIKDENEENTRDPYFISNANQIKIEVKVEYDSNNSLEVDVTDVDIDKNCDAESDNYVSHNQTDDVRDLMASDVESNASDKQKNSIHEKKRNEKVFVKTMDEQAMRSAREKKRLFKRFQMSTLKCHKCVQFFNSQSSLAEHNQLHSKTEGEFQCNICEQHFKCENVLKKHTELHYRYFACKECSYTHQDYKTAMKHWRNNHSTAVLQCDQCSDKFRSTCSLRQHKETVHVRPRCDVCGKYFTKMSYVRKHIMMLHSESGVDMRECPVCHKMYRGDTGLRQHLRTHDNSVHENAFCAECGIQYKNIYQYRVHLKTNSRHVTPKDLKFECADCGKRYCNKRHLRDHIEVMHLRRANYSCAVTGCNKVFNAAVALRRHHREKHEGRVPSRDQVCDVCGKCFIVKSTLKQHMNMHLGVRPYKCKLCDATFSFSGALYTHNKLVHLRLKRDKKS